MLWIVAANTNNCRIYHYEKYKKKLTLIKEIDQPENRLKNHDITTDRPGHYNKSSIRSGSFEPDSTAKDNAINNFSRIIAKLLNRGKQDRLFEKLILVSDAHMLGLINQYLDKSVHVLITQILHKDLQMLSEKELLSYFIEHID